MPYSFEKRLLIGKIETVEGTDATPTVGSNALITVGLDTSGLEADTRVRNTDGQYFGARPSINAQVRRPVRFGVEIAGSGVSAITPPAWMPFLRPAGFDAGTVGGSSVVQAPISAAVPTMTLWPYLDSLKMASLGSRANLTMTFEDDEIPMFNLEYMGFPPSGILADSAPSTPTFAGQATPVICSTSNTTFTFDGYAFALRRLTINMGNKIEPRSLVGPTDKAMFRNREVTAELLVEMPTVATKNPITKFESRATGALQIIHGTAAGNIVQIDAARAETGVITFPEEQGIVMMSIPLRFLPSTATGNDEITVTSK
ncbi:MAG TPA: phage tail tube protein [Allosphingosinicella sp.]|nr:phage tail tube protein [Allosphingosinicella sp.]